MIKQKILVVALGSTPQVLTETIWALYKNHQWIPNRVIALTTLHGKREIMGKLLGENGHFARLKSDYPELQQIEFNEQNIKLFTNKNGEQLEDVRTNEENNASADLIVRTIHDFCQDDETEIHVSLSGGRKSMVFYIGYALSLFGRSQDKMSHVLTEVEYEQCADFFYPTPNTQMVRTRDGKEYDAKCAKIELAEIPFVRMAENKLKFAFEKDITFSQAVQNTQEALNGTPIQFDVKKRTVKIGIVEIKFPAQLFAVYTAMAQRKIQDKGLNIFDKKANDDLVKFAEEYVEIYKYHKKGLRGNSQSAQLERKLEMDNIRNSEYLSEKRTRINRRLREFLGDGALPFEVGSNDKNKQDKVYQLNTDKKWIEIIPYQD